MATIKIHSRDNENSIQEEAQLFEKDGKLVLNGWHSQKEFEDFLSSKNIDIDYSNKSLSEIKHLFIEFIKSMAYNDHNTMYFSVSDSGNIYNSLSYINTFGNGFVLEEDATDNELKCFVDVFEPTVKKSLNYSLKKLENLSADLEESITILNDNFEQRGSYSKGENLVFDIKSPNIELMSDELREKFTEEEINDLFYFYQEMHITSLIEELKAIGATNAYLEGRSGGWIVIEGKNPSVADVENNKDLVDDAIIGIKENILKTIEWIEDKDYQEAIVVLSNSNAEFDSGTVDSIIDNSLTSPKEIRETINDIEKVISRRKEFFYNDWIRFVETNLFLTENDWDEKYTLNKDIVCTQGFSDEPGKLDTNEEDMKILQKIIDTRPKTVWTVVNGEDLNGEETFWISAGIHVVNRSSYLITNEEWEGEDELYLMDTFIDKNNEELIIKNQKKKNKSLNN